LNYLEKLKLNSIKINIFNEEQVKLIINKLPTINFLNGHAVDRADIVDQTNMTEKLHSTVSPNKEEF